MISLATGNPGSGKTLFGLEDLYNLIQGFNDDPDSARPVFVHGVKELTIPHAPLPLKLIPVDKAGTQKPVPDWEAVPDGALVFIDEAQHFFPPASAGAVLPAHVEFLNTHRHSGMDIWIYTQNPRLIRMEVRRLVGRHRYHRRLFGLSRSQIYEWDECSDNHNLKTSVNWRRKFPSHIYDMYKSAEVHTKQTFRKPWWLILFILGPLGMIIGAPYAYDVVMGDVKPKSNLVSSQTGSKSQASSSSLLPQSGPGFVGYVKQGGRCYGVLKNGEIVLEPNACSDKLK